MAQAIADWHLAAHLHFSRDRGLQALCVSANQLRHRIREPGLALWMSGR